MAMASGFDGIFECGPIFRAEQSYTNRHATEFTGFYIEFSHIDGFEDVILCDNGSDKTKPSKYTNLLVEKNNFLRGGIMEAFSFAEENYDFEYIFYTTTSLFYHKHINYKKMLEKQ